LQGQVLPTAPERILPEDMTEVQKGFVDSLDSMYLVFDDAGLFVNVVQRIMIDLKAHPDLMSVFAAEDSNVLMRGIRSSAGMAKVKKEETRAKTAGRGGANKLSNVAADKLAIMQKLGLGGGFGGGS
jgi:hypothetical protein